MNMPEGPYPGGSFSHNPSSISVAQVSESDRLHQFRYIIFHLTPRVFVAHGLVAINVLVYVAMVVSGVDFYSPSAVDLIDWGANYGPLTLAGQLQRLLTSMFLHIGIVHIALNMWVLWEIGPLAERLLGNLGFLFMYLIAGLMGSLASLYWNPELISAGASGAIFGVVGAILAFTMLQRRSIPVEAFSGIRSSMLAFVGYNLLFGFVLQAAKPNGIGIDMGAHLGGLLAGMICGLILSQPLTLESGRRRWLRNAALLAVGVLMVGGSLKAMPAGPDDIQGELQRFSDVERQAIEAFNALGRKVNANEIDAQAFAASVEKDVIAPWHEAHERFRSMKRVPQSKQSLVAQLLQYMQLREDSFRLAVEAAREDSGDKLAQFQEKQTAAEALLKTLNDQ